MITACFGLHAPSLSLAFFDQWSFPVPSLAGFSPSLHLQVSDIALDSSSAPSYMRVHIKASKTDPFRRGCQIQIGLGSPPLCAVRAMLSCLSLRGPAPGPLFLFQDGQPLTHSRLTSWVRQIIATASIRGNFSSHSFRIGAATVAACNGIPDHQIQTLGHWTSDAFKLYIRTPADVLASLSSHLASH